MANFADVSNNLTVPAGTAGTWVNKDSGPRHSATAADGSFDTGLFDAGEQSTLTFDTPGTYVYYCTLHGSPDGSGMAATITVTD
jgi:plastocyanin